MNKILICVIVVPGAFFSYGHCTNTIEEVRDVIVSFENRLPRDQKISTEIFNGDVSFSANVGYALMAMNISNHWQCVLDNMGKCATNQFERLLVLSVRDRFGADFYVDFVNKLVDLRTNAVLTAHELEWALCTEDPELENYFERKYREPKARALATRFRGLGDRADYWDRVLSGAAYTNYIEEVSAGLWGENPPR